MTIPFYSPKLKKKKHRLIDLKRANREKQNYHFWLKKPVHFREVLRCHDDPKKAKKPLHFREEVAFQNLTI